MKKIVFTLIIILVNYSLTFSQNALLWSTYYGGSLYEVANCSVTDAAGNIYLAGYTSSPNGIASGGGFQNTYAGGTYDAFLVKFDPTGMRLWATYFGSNDNDYAMALAYDPAGFIYLAGGTSSMTGISSGGFQSTYGGGSYDAMLVKFDLAGNRIWSTYYGGSVWDEAQGVAVDAFGNVYISGFTNSLSNIASGGFQNTFGGGTYDSFLVKFDSSGNRMWSTYYGGSGSEGYDGNSVAIDSFGNVFLSGWTASTSDIAFNGHQNNYSGNFDVYLVKFDSTGNRIWGTYFGGSGIEGGISNILAGKNIASDYQGNIYLAGTTTSSSSIAVGGYQNVFGGGSHDCYLAKFDSAGTLSWSTYFGGSGDERGWNASTDIYGNIFISGRTNSASGIANAGFQNSLAGNYDIFVASFSPSGSLYCSSYFGGTDGEWAYAPALDNAGNLMVPGFTYSTSGISNSGFQQVYGGGTYDAYLVKMQSCAPTGIEESSISDFVIFPNPFSTETVLIPGKEFNDATIILSNSLGKEVRKINHVNGNRITIDRKGLSNGIYFISIATNEYPHLRTGKVVISGN